MASYRCFLPCALFFILAITGCQPPPSLHRPTHPLPEDVEISSCTPGRPGGMFITTNSNEPNSFNPLVIEDADSSEIAGLFLESLLTIDPVTQEIIPALARSWELSADKKSVTLHLRRGVRWSDGHPFTADDVIFTFSAFFDRRYPNRYSGQFTIAGQPLKFEKMDDWTVRFSTAEVYSPLLNDLTYAAILPRHKLLAAYENGSLQKQWTVETGIRSPQELVGTGPFCLLSYRPGDRLLMAPNPHYWRADSRGQRLPYLNLYIVKFVKDQNAELIHFATGQSDSSAIPATDVGWVRRGESVHQFKIHDRGPATSISFIWFNQHPGRDKNGKPYVAPHKLKWFQDRRFRRAIAYGFNRQGLVDGVYFGRASLLHSIISEGNVRWYNPHVPRVPYDPATARQLLSEAGFRRDGSVLRDAAGHPVEFEILAPQGSQTAPMILTSFIEDMKALGIQVKLSYVDFGTMIARTSQSFDYEAGIMGFTGGGDPSGGKAIYLSSGRLHLWYPEQPQPATAWEARIDQIMALQERTFDFAERKKLIDELQVIIAEERPLIFLVTPNTYLGLRAKWRNALFDTRGRIVLRMDELWEDTQP